MSKFIEKVEDILAEISLEETRSVASYDDCRLTNILNAYCASQLIRELLEDNQALRTIAKNSYTHSNGFDKITLISSSNPEFKLRLHIWWPKEPNCQKREFIHNHRWLFRSTVLSGSASLEIYTEKDSGELMYHHEYYPRDDVLERYDLKVVGQSRLVADLTCKLTPGSTYSMSPDMLHRVLWGDDTVSVTMFVRWESIRSKAAVFSEAEIAEKQMFFVPSFTEDQLRSKLELILAALAS